MNRELMGAIHDWDREVERETIRLIEEGTPPFDAVERAKNIVTRRRQEKARQSKEAAA